jgi:hypothetical protein
MLHFTNIGPEVFLMASGSPVIIKFRAIQIEPGGFCQGCMSVSLRQAQGPVHLIKLYKP